MKSFSARPITRDRLRNGFTLVEILVSIVISGIIASMLTVALRGANRQAKELRARTMIERLNYLMLQIYEEESERLVPSPPTIYSGESRALMSLMWKHDWLRCSLPDRREDIAFIPVPIPLATSTGTVFLEDVTVPGINSGSVPAGICATSVFRYRQYIARSIGAAKGISVANFGLLLDGNDANGEWTAQYQSAECLYLILATRVVNGSPAIDSLHDRDIGDVDDDGMPEVLDPWGQPLGFLRWPCGFSMPLDWEAYDTSTPTVPTTADLAARKRELGKDSLDILYSDPRYQDTSFANHEADDPFPIVPMIVSAGGDGVFDLYGLDDQPGVTPPTPPVVNYTQRAWPGGAVPTGFPVGAPYNMSYVDPYLSGNAVNVMLGARVDANEDRLDNTADNVSLTLDVR